MGRVNDLNVFFPSGTADFVLENSDTTTSSDTIALVISTLQTFNSSKSATSFKYSLPLNPRMWNRTTDCDRRSDTCTYIFDVLVGNLTLTATYTFFREDTVVVLGTLETKVRGGDFRLDLVATPLAGSNLYRVELLLESNTALAGNLSMSNGSQLNLQSGPIAMNISFMEWNPQANASSMTHIVYSKTSNFSSLMTIDFQMSLIGFFRIANFEEERGRFRWWMPVVAIVGLLVIFVAILLFAKCALPRLRRFLRRRRRRAIEMRAARVVTA